VTSIGVDPRGERPLQSATPAIVYGSRIEVLAETAR
jgi:hypothetical protein